MMTMKRPQVIDELGYVSNKQTRTKLEDGPVDKQEARDQPSRGFLAGRVTPVPMLSFSSINQYEVCNGHNGCKDERAEGLTLHLNSGLRARE